MRTSTTPAASVAIAAGLVVVVRLASRNAGVDAADDELLARPNEKVAVLDCG